MSVSRRQVIRLGQALLASATLPVRLIGSEQPLDSGSPGHLLSRATFEPLVNTSFSVNMPAGEFAWLTLMSVEDTTTRVTAGGPGFAVQSPVSANSATTESFALHFYSANETLGQATYQLTHRATGRFDLFIVPSGRFRYTAIINQLPGFVPGMEVPVRKKRPAPAPAAAETRLPE